MAMSTTQKSKSKDQNSLSLLSNLEEWILLVMRNKEMYGWDILKAINEASKGKRKVSFGSLYPALHRLEKKQFVESWWGDEQPEDRSGARKRYYKITSLGQQALHQTEDYRQALATVGSSALIPAN